MEPFSKSHCGEYSRILALWLDFKDVLPRLLQMLNRPLTEPRRDLCCGRRYEIDKPVTNAHSSNAPVNTPVIKWHHVAGELFPTQRPPSSRRSTSGHKLKRTINLRLHTLRPAAAQSTSHMVALQTGSWAPPAHKLRVRVCKTHFQDFHFRR